MKVTLFYGASAYAHVLDPQAGVFMDIKLEPGRSASQSLRETAAEYQEKSARYARMARICADAATVLHDEHCAK